MINLINAEDIEKIRLKLDDKIESTATRRLRRIGDIHCGYLRNRDRKFTFNLVVRRALYMPSQ